MREGALASRPILYYSASRIFLWVERRNFPRHHVQNGDVIYLPYYPFTPYLISIANSGAFARSQPLNLYLYSSSNENPQIPAIDSNPTYLPTLPIHIIFLGTMLKLSLQLQKTQQTHAVYKSHHGRVDTCPFSESKLRKRGYGEPSRYKVPINERL